MDEEGEKSLRELMASMKPRGKEPKSAGSVEDQGKLRQELAALLRDNIDEIAERMERNYVLEYSHSRANRMDARVIHQWTLDDIEGVAQLVETGDPSLRTYRGAYGDALEDAHNPELTMFANFICSTLFAARHIAPVFFRMETKDMVRMRAIMDLFERTMQESIAYNCELYAASVMVPGSLSRTWDMVSGMVPQGDPVDTPAKRYLELGDDGDPDQRIAPLGAAANEHPAFRGQGLLSDREREVLNLLVAGETNGEIASALGVRQNTVKNHVAHIFDKCNVNTRTELVALVLGGRRRDG